MRVRNHGKWTGMRRYDPRAIGTCDHSGLMSKRSVMKEQLAYRGRGLVGTGLIVKPSSYDKPNPQDLTPLIRMDPIPIYKPRPDSQIGVYQPSNFTLDVSGNSNVTLTNEQFNNTNFLFKGVLTGDVIISIPWTFNEFNVLNITTGDFTLSIQLITNFSSNKILPKNVKIILFNDSESLTVITNK